VPDLGGTPPVLGKGLVGRFDGCEGVAVEHGHFESGAGQTERSPQASDSTAHHDYRTFDVGAPSSTATSATRVAKV
jgi:hypothetical protein